MNQRPPAVERVILAILVSLTIAACGGGGPATPRSVPTGSPSPSQASPPGAMSSAAVSIKGFAFAPDALTVPAGTTVTWTNDEDSLHTVTSGSPASPTPAFDSGEIDTGVAFSYTFTDEGMYPFFCARHDFMEGVVTVTP